MPQKLVSYLSFALVLFSGLGFAGAAGDPLLDALDVTRPDLAAVRNAYDKGEVAAARKSFADYLRKRTSIKWKFDPDNPPRDLTPQEKVEADEALHHKLHSIAHYSYPYQFGDPIDWAFDPTSVPNSPVVYTPEWVFAVNRHYVWTVLARAYSATGDAKYAVELCKQLHGWIQSRQPEPAARHELPGSTWRGIEAGFRMSDTWPEVYFRLIHHPDVFPDDVLLEMVNSMRQHAEMLEVRTGFGIHNNHRAVECDGLYHVGALFPEFKQAEKWRRDGVEQQFDEIAAEVYPDGAQKELAPSYHMLALESFAGILETAERNGYPLPSGYKPSLEKMYAALMWSMMPNRECPPFNDSGGDSVIPNLKRGLPKFPNHPDWEWMVSEGKKGTEPAEKSHFFEYAGWPVMRSGWDRDACYFIMECGPYGLAHQHEDKLSFMLRAYGAQLVAEGGVYTYDASDMRKYILSARAHNVIHVDGMEQVRHGGPAKYFVTDHPVNVNWHSTDSYDFAQGEYGNEEDERWGPQRIAGFVQTRRVLYVKPDLWIIFDTVLPPDDQEHTYESTFHLDAPQVRVDPKTNVVRTLNDGPNLTIFPLANHPLDVRIITGQTKPFYQGWIARTETEVSPSPTCYLTVKCKGPAQYLYLFSPSRPNEAGPITEAHLVEASADAMAADMTFANAATAHVAMTKDGSIDFIPADGKPIHIAPSNEN